MYYDEVLEVGLLPDDGWDDEPLETVAEVDDIFGMTPTEFDEWIAYCEANN